VSAPTLLKRNLTFNFQRSVNTVDGVQVPQTIEVAITPLATPSFPDVATYVGGVQEQTVLLNNATNQAVFALVPSNAAGLTQNVNYLTAIRQGGVTGPTTNTPFAMPDADTDWDTLVASLGDVIGGVSYVQQSDIGVAGGVAALNSSGAVVDANGNPVTVPGDLTTLTTGLADEITARQTGDATVTSNLTTAYQTGDTNTLASAKSYTDTQFESLTASVNSEIGGQQNAINAVSTALTTDNTNLQNQITTLNTTVAGHTAALPNKADLDTGGHVPMTEIPTAAVTSWIAVADLTAMYALTYPTQVQLGDVAYLAPGGAPNGLSYVLIGTNPVAAASWLPVNMVTGVNGKTGAVTLSASDVGAVATGSGTVNISQVTGLSTQLGLKANETDLTTLQNQVNTIQGDQTIVHANAAVSGGGVVPDSVMPNDVAFLNSDNNLVRKNGTIVPIGNLSGVSMVNGQTGVVQITPSSIGALNAATGTITEGQVTGLSTDLNNRVLSTDTRLTNARTTTSHASTHASGGSDPITISQGQVTGLSTALGLLAPQSQVSANAGAITALQTSKADLVSGTVPLSEMSQVIPISYIQGLSAYLINLNPTYGTFDASKLTNLVNLPAGVPITAITGLATALTGKADLTGPGGTVSPAQLPTTALTHTFQVTSQAAMLGLTQATQGDICVITQGANLGTYILNGSDPTVLSNWVLLLFPGAVSSVNSQTGAVVITAASLGAMLANTTTIGQNQVVGLQTALANAVSTTQLNTAVATQVQAAQSAAQPNKQTVNYVATAAIPSLAGVQTIDGVSVVAGSRVLATNQPSSVNNGIWVTTSSGAWTRPADFATGSYLLQGALVVVTAGNTMANTLWQETAVSGVVDTAINNWSNIGSVAGQQAYTQGNGITITGTQVAAKVATGGGLQNGTAGLSLDPAVSLKKVTGTVPSPGSAVVQITHNLNNLAPGWIIVDVASGNIVDVGPTVINANILSFEFQSPPASGQYRYMIWG